MWVVFPRNPIEIWQMFVAEKTKHGHVVFRSFAKKNIQNIMVALVLVWNTKDVLGIVFKHSNHPDIGWIILDRQMCTLHSSDLLGDFCFQVMFESAYHD